MTKVLMLVNGEPGGAAAIRATAFADRFGPEIQCTLCFRTANKVGSLVRFIRESRGLKPDVTYVVDMAYSGVIAAGIYRLFWRNRLVVDTGDAIYELARSVGERGRLGMWLTWWLEWFGLWSCDAVVVRGTGHQTLLGDIGKPVVVVQDGVDTRTFQPVEVGAVRAEIAARGAFTVGMVGTSVWSDRLGICYGWELVEVIYALRHRNVVGVLIGGGAGIERLRTRCVELGIEDRVRFVGFVRYDDLPGYLGALDVCLSTQTNDVPGNVRTTGKLPLYLAAGGLILASRVGEAARVLDDRQLVDYRGVVDSDYPRRLARRIEQWMDAPDDRETLIALNRKLARERFEYDTLSQRVVALMHSLGS